MKAQSLDHLLTVDRGKRRELFNDLHQCQACFEEKRRSQGLREVMDALIGHIDQESSINKGHSVKV